ncbi:MAG: hypothetical protein AAB890_02830 [Patescibacteria group bacterium]
MPDKSVHNNKGYLLIESIIAITLVTVGLLGIFSLLSRSLSLNRVVSDRVKAAYLAAEGIEIVKNLIDNNLIQERPWNYEIGDGEHEVDYRSVSLAPRQVRFLNFNPVDGFYSYDNFQSTNFQRTIAINTSTDGQEIRVNSKVNWTTRGGGKFDINLEDHFFNWRQ